MYIYLLIIICVIILFFIIKEKRIEKLDLINTDSGAIREIKDFFGEELASNEPLYQVHLIPENTKDLNNLFVRLKAILNITDTRVSYLRRIIKRCSDCFF